MPPAEQETHMGRARKRKRTPPQPRRDASKIVPLNTGGTTMSNIGFGNTSLSQNDSQGITKKWWLVALILVFLVEGVGVLWLSSKQKDLDKQAKEAHSLELKLSQ